MVLFLMMMLITSLLSSPFYFPREMMTVELSADIDVELFLLLCLTLFARYVTFL